MANASINDIKGRIKSVQGTMQITKAMELVATSKLRHLKERAEKTKPYLETLCSTMRKISDTVSADSPFSKVKDGKTLYIVVAGDRGLAGGYNSNVFKLLSSLDQDGMGIYLPIGKKAVDYFSKRNREILSLDMRSVADATVGKCFLASNEICSKFLDGSIASVKLIYTRFVSMLSQVPVCEDIFPLRKTDSAICADPICETDPEELLEKIIPQYVGGLLHAAICEASASECAARRTAMNSANKNAEEMIGDLVLKFNRARQAVITQEITEIVSGAEAL